ncbi:MAG: helix-turn-helix transcriptional regulator [Pseudomonadota bacterium]
MADGLTARLMRASHSMADLDAFVHRLRQETRADAAIFRLLDLADFSYPVTMTAGDVFTDAFFEEYDAGVGLSDPQLKVGLDHKLPKYSVYLCHEHYSEADREQDPYFANFLKKHDIKWFAGYLAQFGGVAAGFGVARRSGKPRFGDQEKTMLSRLSPVLEACSACLIEGQRNRLVANALKAAWRRRSGFAACLDAQGRLLWADDVARAVLAKTPGVVVRDNIAARDKSASTPDSAVGAHAIDCARDVARGRIPPSAPMTLALSDGGRVDLDFERVSAEPGDFADAAFNGCAIYGETHIIAANPAAPHAGDLERLSARERHIADFVAQGLTTVQISQQIGVAPSTAQTHLKRAYKKLGIRNKQQLAALVAEHRARAGGR